MYQNSEGLFSENLIDLIKLGPPKISTVLKINIGGALSGGKTYSCLLMMIGSMPLFKTPYKCMTYVLSVLGSMHDIPPPQRAFTQRQGVKRVAKCSSWCGGLSGYEFSANFAPKRRNWYKFYSVLWCKLASIFFVRFRLTNKTQ